MENLARYIIRASFSQERMTYLPEESRIIYRSKDNRQEKAFDALDWLAAMPACASHADRTSHIPNQGEQTVRYYGDVFYFLFFRDSLKCHGCRLCVKYTYHLLSER